MNPRISRRAGRSDRQVGSGDLEVERDLAGRVVGHRARVVVVRPDAGVVVEFGDLEDLVLGFDVAVFGGADVHADPGPVDLLPIDAGIADRFVGTVDRDRSGPRPATALLSLLVQEFVEIADPGEDFADVACFEGHDTGPAGEEGRAIIVEAVAVRRGEPHAGDDDAVRIVE